jgi:hypothetical protein
VSRRWVLRLARGTLVLLSIPALAAGVAYFLVYFWMLPYFDDVAPGSLEWYIALPRYLTAAPTLAACNEPRYSLHFIDGLKPGDAIVAFQTRASAAELRAAYARELTACRPQPGVPHDTGGWGFLCDGSWYDRVLLSLAPGEGCRRARITFEFY